MVLLDFLEIIFTSQRYKNKIINHIFAYIKIIIYEKIPHLIINDVYHIPKHQLSSLYELPRNKRRIRRRFQLHHLRRRLAHQIRRTLLHPCRRLDSRQHTYHLRPRHQRHQRLRTTTITHLPSGRIYQ